jgi:Zinc dependent phospholipase C.
MKKKETTSILSVFLALVLVGGTVIPGVMAVMPIPVFNEAISENSVKSIPNASNTDAERTQFVNALRMEGLSDKEIVEQIMMNYDSSIPDQRSNTELTANEKIEIAAQTLDRIVISDSIKYASQGLWVILVADDDFKKQLLSEIDKSTDKTISKELLKNNIQEIWKKYKIKSTKIGSVTYFDFELDNVELNKEEIQTLQQVNEIHFEVFLLNDSSSGPKWTVNPCHQDIIYYAIVQSLKQYHPMLNYADNAKNHAGDPDVGLPWNAYNHYYNPDGFWPFLGGAPASSLIEYNYARSAFISYNFDSSSAFIANSSHYMSDVGNPMHTGYEIDTIFNQTLHNKYEAYVTSQWVADGFNFKSSVQGNSINYIVEEPDNATIHLAEYSHQNIDTLYQKLYTLSTEQLLLDGWTKVLTQAWLVKTSRYVNGLVDLWLLSPFPGLANLPTDPDTDQSYEDLNGNGRLDFNDVVLLYNNLDWVTTNESYRLFDYDDNSEIDMNDVSILMNEL